MRHAHVQLLVIALRSPSSGRCSRRRRSPGFRAPGSRMRPSAPLLQWATAFSYWRSTCSAAPLRRAVMDSPTLRWPLPDPGAHRDPRPGRHRMGGRGSARTMGLPAWPSDVIFRRHGAPIPPVRCRGRHLGQADPVADRTSRLGQVEMASTTTGPALDGDGQPAVPALELLQARIAAMFQIEVVRDIRREQREGARREEPACARQEPERRQRQRRLELDDGAS